MNIIEMDALLKRSLRPGRYIHSVNTMKEAISLAEHYGEDKAAAAVAGLLHDCAKNLKDEETREYCRANGIKLNEIEQRQVFLMHGEVGAILAKEQYGVEDNIILNAIRYHTTGFAKMSPMDKIVFLADYIEPGRTHCEADDVRRLAYADINKALVCAFDNIIKYVIMQNGLLHPFTIEARNKLLLQNKDF
ncbi:putative HD superfamily hydrolase involved in NAD metabolism [Ruminiclostridium sufflavum DSM 19573]|uniref:bis(5'-nucleosyl)-tetraphosphatase (symmetrical) n=1 Tax=Ruminiclostridium sufflavum DSM 19573 TaxID=1121337 RepID=A0A318XKE9_9FIRM|nr:bis(5'-nucleosyl)-tetraphosphatase (symmetrical) YqeK [Ruminiclostridium sufflavum]PYG86938.1 putative HD superfamily hydrolase involved in NAD metabolism [Ruminiclostridium sufflavum DSM 19573]